MTTSPDSQELTVSVETAAKILGISRNLAYTACRSGELPSLRIGKRIVIPRAAIERMLSKTREGN